MWNFRPIELQASDRVVSCWRFFHYTIRRCGFRSFWSLWRCFVSRTETGWAKQDGADRTRGWKAGSTMFHRSHFDGWNFIPMRRGGDVTNMAARKRVCACVDVGGRPSFIGSLTSTTAHALTAACVSMRLMDDHRHRTNVLPQVTRHLPPPWLGLGFTLRYEMLFERALKSWHKSA